MPCDGSALSTLLEVADFVVHAADGAAFRLPAMLLQRGEVHALYGPSGCGKTTLLFALFGLLRRPGWSVAGRVSCGGRELASVPAEEHRRLLRQDVAFLQQDAHTALDPLQPVGAQIAQATGRPEGEVQAMRQQLGVADAAALCSRLPHAISGGQAQRALLAIAFLRQPALVVADEPSASLDGGNYAELVAQLQALIARGSAVLMATHDHRLLRDLAASVYTLQDGSFVRGEPAPLPWPVQPREGIGTVPVLAARGLGVAFGARTVLDGDDLELRRGEIVAIAGESGAGKTTLVRVLAGHRQPDRGRVERPDRRTAVQLVCQDAYGSLTPGRPLQSLLAEAKAPFFDAAAGAASVRLGAELLERTRERLSGGERRRAAMLRALAVQPDVLMLDEPTASLDRATAVAVIESLMAMQKRLGLAMIVVTHDLELARAIAHRVLVVQGGRLCPG